MNDASDFWVRMDVVIHNNGKKNMKAFCREAGVPYQTIVNQRVQGRYPTVEMLKKFADVVDFSLDWLILGKEYSFEKNVFNIANRMKAAGEREMKVLKSMSV